MKTRRVRFILVVLLGSFMWLLSLLSTPGNESHHSRSPMSSQNETTMAANKRAIMYLASKTVPSSYIQTSLQELCNRFRKHAFKYDLVFVFFPGEEPFRDVPERCNSLFRRVLTKQVDPTSQGPNTHTFFSENVDNRSYKLMIWFWLRAIITHPEFSDYHYIIRLDSDSIFLSDVTVDPVDERIAKKDCWEFLHSFLQNKQPSYPGFKISQGAIGMFYTNFMVFDRAGLSQRQDIIQFTDTVLKGIIQARWGDAPLWGVIAGIYLTPDTVVHINQFSYQHARDNRFITLESNGETVEWYFERWKKGFGRPPTGHCFDRRVPLKCIYESYGGLKDEECPKPFFQLR